MTTLFEDTTAANEAYRRVYTALGELREWFHKSGRLDDSNAKLDEIAKLLASYLAFRKGRIERFPCSRSPTLVEELQEAFRRTAALPQYRLDGNRSIFGLQPSLMLGDGDNDLAHELLQVVRECVDSAFDVQVTGRPFDVINEAFGHFVRDNFRSNIEDAQYLTPPEIVTFMADMVLHDIAAERRRSRRGSGDLTVVDPTCGVGSFLTSVYHRAEDIGAIDPHRLRLFGQDKVERMVRLATLNLELFSVLTYRVTLGNSLEQGSPIDDLNGSVDLVLTNPPFGAGFPRSYVEASCGDNTPFFSHLRKQSAPVESELLFIDRDLRLLRNGGRLVIVVPDSVVSARGTAARLRLHLGKVAEVCALIELPSVAFAQAGTRTKTAILYLRKGRTPNPKPVFMGVVTDLGFQVASRKGATLKALRGENQLPAVLAEYTGTPAASQGGAPRVLRSDPSCVLVSEPEVLGGTWTPNHYNALRFRALESTGAVEHLDLQPLAELAEFCSGSRRPRMWKNGHLFLSVLHILGEGFVDVSKAITYRPRTPGRVAHPGELLVSRINPRIPRVCVVPDLGMPVLCSSEFEILMVRPPLDAYALAYLLQASPVQDQIRSLTSGTSASHNRIRASDLGRVLIPLPLKGTPGEALLSSVASDYRLAVEAINRSALSLAQIRSRDAEILPRHAQPEA